MRHEFLLHDHPKIKMISYFGGKSYLASWIICHFPEKYQQQTYCEVFGGGGWVLFKKEPSKIEIYNDLNQNLVNLFRVIRDNYKKFAHQANWSIHSRAMFDEAIEKLKNDQFLSETERAVFYALRQVQSFSGTGTHWTYRLSSHHSFSGKWLPFLKRMELINARLKKVQIECLDFEDVIKKYDSRTTLFYLDPPYVDTERYYNSNNVEFKKEDHLRLAHVLKRIKGRFVLSYYEHKFVRANYKQYSILSKNMPKYSINSSRNTGIKTKPTGKELLIKNF